MSKRPYLNVIASAVLFGLGTPLSKLLIRDLSPLALAGLLYLGAALGLTLYAAGRKAFLKNKEDPAPPLRKKDWPWLAGSILTGGIVGPVCLLFGLAQLSGYAASLLLNLEGIATALIAVLIFKESAGRRIWLALASMTCAGVFLSWDPGRSRFAVTGTLLILAAMAGWGLDNNLMRNIADRNPVQITRIKGLVAGIFSLGMALVLGSKVSSGIAVASSLVLGAFSYGISLVLYLKALRGIGAFRAGAFFSFAPFVGALVSLLVLPDPARWVLVPGAILMVLGVVLIAGERHEHPHRHEALVHAHVHEHRDGHHLHTHDGALAEPHAHEHVHEELDHVHGHWPDTHHRHRHD